MSGPAGGFEEIPHTADRAIRAWGETLSALFVHAARGMYSLAGIPEAGSRGEEEVAVEVEAASAEGLLVAWLNELLYLTETKKLFFRDFAVESLLLPPEEEERWGGMRTGVEGEDAREERDLAFLRGRARGVRLTGIPARYIKAATYHNLEIVREDGRYVAEVVFDV